MRVGEGRGKRSVQDTTPREGEQKKRKLRILASSRRKRATPTPTPRHCLHRRDCAIGPTYTENWKKDTLVGSLTIAWYKQETFPKVKQSALTEKNSRKKIK